MAYTDTTSSYSWFSLVLLYEHKLLNVLTTILMHEKIFLHTFKLVWIPMRLTLLMKGKRRTGWVDTSSFCDVLGFWNDLFRWSPSFIYVLLPIMKIHKMLSAPFTLRIYSRNGVLITKKLDFDFKVGKLFITERL